MRSQEPQLLQFLERDIHAAERDTGLFGDFTIGCGHQFGPAQQRKDDAQSRRTEHPHGTPCRGRCCGLAACDIDEGIRRAQIGIPGRIDERDILRLEALGHGRRDIRRNQQRRAREALELRQHRPEVGRGQPGFDLDPERRRSQTHPGIGPAILLDQIGLESGRSNPRRLRECLERIGKQLFLFGFVFVRWPGHRPSRFDCS